MRFNDVLHKGSIIAQLNHQKSRNRVMPVTVDFDHLIGEPLHVPGIGWAVPCDVVGLESKKAKLVKVRFHPSLAELSRVDRSIVSAAKRDALKYLDALLEYGEWTRHPGRSIDPHVCHVDRIAHFMTMRRPVLTVTHRSVVLTWSLHKEHRDTFAKTEKFTSEARCSLHNHSIATGVVATVKEMGGEGAKTGQEVEVAFEKPGLSKPILKLSFLQDASYLQCGSLENCWELTNNDNCLRLTLPRTESQNDNLPLIVPQEARLHVFTHQNHVPMVEDSKTIEDFLLILEDYWCEAVHTRQRHVASTCRPVGGCHYRTMIESCQMRVDDLRRRLDDSLAKFQRSASRHDTKARALHIVRQNHAEVLVEISDPGERARFDRLMASSPLNVICCNGSPSAVATSPADSTDSGVVISPLSSPLSSKHSPFYQYSEQVRMGMRQRSASDCAEWDGVVLKSILKKPQRVDRFTRSVSESHHFAPDSMPLSLLLESTEEVDEIETHTDQEGQMVVHREKHVSFSEKVQERRFRVGQCILTATKKSERKRAYRKRKEERQRGLKEDNDSGQKCNESEILVSPDDVDSEEMPGLRSERLDSGFVDGDENEYQEGESDKSTFPPNKRTENPEDCWKSLVRQQREVAATH